MTISEWLKSLSLERYAPVFVENEIDFANLPLLSEEDLKELGLPLGPRRRIFSAIRALSAVEDASTAGHVPEPERRHITVLFADMVDSTVMASSSDPEAVDKVFKMFRDAVSSEIVKHDGHIAKFLGDGVMAYFGWPHAREDAAETAVRAGLKIVAAVSRLSDPTGRGLHSRVGIASGLVVIGGFTGSGEAREENIAGEPPHLAARMQSLAARDEVVIAESTRRLAGGLFEYENLGEREVKGFAAPVAVWQVKSELAAASRFSASRQLHGDLVGRSHECERLRQAWARTLEGRGGLVVISGEAGMGKSRLVSSLRESANDAPHTCVFWQCSPFHTNSALFPVICQIENAARFEAHDNPAEKLGKLRALLKQHEMPFERAVPLLAEMLSLPVDHFPTLDLTPVQRKAALIATLADMMARIAARSPLLIVLEDAHWIDATTPELVARLVKQGRTASQLIVMTTRPGASLPWVDYAPVDAIALERLQPIDCTRIVDMFSGQDSLPRDVVERIVMRSDGNPLYLEELALAVARSTAQENATVPETLQDSLMARLDDVSDVRELVQIASVIGRRFSRVLLSLVAARSNAAVDADVSTLISADIVHDIGQGDAQFCEFKHALLCDAAYESLTFPHRRQLHAAVAKYLETDFPETVETQPELLAHHFERAEMPKPASKYAERAGDRAIARYANVEAIANYRTALSQIACSEAGPARDRRELEVLFKLGPALALVRGPQHYEHGELYRRAASVAEMLGDLDSLFKAQWGLWHYRSIARDFDAASGKADELVALSGRTGDKTHMLEAIHCRWASALFLGDWNTCLADARRGIALYEREQHHRLASLFGGHDPGACAHWATAVSHCMRGQAAQSRRDAAATLALIDDLHHAQTEVFALVNLLNICAALHDYDEAFKYSERLLALIERYNFPAFRPEAGFYNDWASSRDSRDALPRFLESFERAFKVTPTPGLCAAMTAERLIEHGRAVDAIALLDRALASRSIRGSAGHYMSEVARLRGEALLIRDGENSMEAGAAFLSAREIANRQDSPLLGLRAALSAAKTTALRDTARAGLPALLAAFADEDRNLPELVEARAML